jgi:uncharacterized protein (DUF1697 family)
MANARLRAVCEGLGLENVATVISSGNVVFEAGPIDVPGLESTMEAAWQDHLGFASTTIIRSRQALQDLVALRPFGALEHGPTSYLLVTFSKVPLTIGFDVPHRPPGRDYQVVGVTERELFTVTDTTSERTPDVMGWIEAQFGRRVSSRTWLTLGRILKAMG